MGGGGDGAGAARAGCYFAHDPNISRGTKLAVGFGGLTLATGGALAVLLTPTELILLGAASAPGNLADGLPPFLPSYLRAASTVTVGRWMSQAELKAMQATGRVQESFNAGVTSVTLPANPAAYGAARAGDVFVRFDVSQSAIGAADGVWGKIFGPNSIFGPARGITEMPPATNIVVGP